MTEPVPPVVVHYVTIQKTTFHRMTSVALDLGALRVREDRLRFNDDGTVTLAMPEHVYRGLVADAEQLGWDETLRRLFAF